MTIAPRDRARSTELSVLFESTTKISSETRRALSKVAPSVSSELNDRTITVGRIFEHHESGPNYLRTSQLLFRAYEIRSTLPSCGEASEFTCPLAPTGSNSPSPTVVLQDGSRGFLLLIRCPVSRHRWSMVPGTAQPPIPNPGQHHRRQKSRASARRRFSRSPNPGLEADLSSGIPSKLDIRRGHSLFTWKIDRRLVTLIGEIAVHFEVLSYALDSLETERV